MLSTTQHTIASRPPHVDLLSEVKLRMIQLLKQDQPTAGKVYHTLKNEFSDLTPELLGQCATELLDTDVFEVANDHA